jgi:hypothetical protein
MCVYVGGDENEGLEVVWPMAFMPKKAGAIEVDMSRGQYIHVGQPKNQCEASTNRSRASGRYPTSPDSAS